MNKLSETQPLTIKGYLRQNGLALSGSVRASLSRELDDSLFAYWSNACEMFGGEDAAVMLFALVANDPSYRLPLWAIYRLNAHRAAIIAAVDGGDMKHCQHALDNWGRK